VEAIHAGDPVPVTLTVTEQMKAQDNPLGVTSGGRTRRFRVSGFTRQYLTYAEQMQIFALLCGGFLFAALGIPRNQPNRPGTPNVRRWLLISTLLFSFFSLALVLTASRAVIVSFLLALPAISLLTGLRRASLLAALLAALLGALAFYVVTATRPSDAASLHDDSAARRLSYMRAGLRVIPQYPFLGVGMDAHMRHWREWGFPGEFLTHTHSTPLQIALDRGLPALACYLWLLAVMLALALSGYRQARARGDRFAAGWLLGAFGAVLGFSLSSLANYNFGDSEVLMLLLAVVGLALVTAQPPTAAPSSAQNVSRTLR
jgi:O-antigen ligase